MLSGIRLRWNNWIRVMVFNTTFNNISVLSWRPVLLVEETRKPEETTESHSNQIPCIRGSFNSLSDDSPIRKAWRYQRGNQKIKGLTTQWPTDTKGVIKRSKDWQYNGHKIPKG